MRSCKGHNYLDRHRKIRDDVEAHVFERNITISDVGLNELLELGFKNELNKLWYCVLLYIT